MTTPADESAMQAAQMRARLALLEAEAVDTPIKQQPEVYSLLIGMFMRGVAWQAARAPSGERKEKRDG